MAGKRVYDLPKFVVYDKTHDTYQARVLVTDGGVRAGTRYRDKAPAIAEAAALLAAATAEGVLRQPARSSAGPRWIYPHSNGRYTAVYVDPATRQRSNTGGWPTVEAAEAARAYRIQHGVWPRKPRVRPGPQPGKFSQLGVESSVQGPE